MHFVHDPSAEGQLRLRRGRRLSQTQGRPPRRQPDHGDRVQAEMDSADGIARVLRILLRYDDAEMHVPVDVAARVREAAAKQCVDAIVSVGGSPTIDLAKAITLATCRACCRRSSSTTRPHPHPPGPDQHRLVPERARALPRRHVGAKADLVNAALAAEKHPGPGRRPAEGRHRPVRHRRPRARPCTPRTCRPWRSRRLAQHCTTREEIRLLRPGCYESCSKHEPSLSIQARSHKGQPLLKEIRRMLPAVGAVGSRRAAGRPDSHHDSQLAIG
jgi:hypothetical protein